MGLYVATPKPPEGRVFERVHTRKLDRFVAHERMKKAKMQHVNKHDYSGPAYLRTRVGSYFSTHWREVANQEMKNM